MDLVEEAKLTRADIDNLEIGSSLHEAQLAKALWVITDWINSIPVKSMDERDGDLRSCQWQLASILGTQLEVAGLERPNALVS